MSVKNSKAVEAYAEALNDLEGVLMNLLEFVRELPAPEGGVLVNMDYNDLAFVLQMREHLGEASRLADALGHAPPVRTERSSPLLGSLGEHVYYSPESDNFYLTGNNQGLGIEFYRAYICRKDDFPQRNRTGAADHA
jgi:hypothetical protein